MAPVSAIILSYLVPEHKEQREVRSEDVNSEKEWARKSGKTIKLLGPELFFFNFSTPVYKMWIIQQPHKLELWNKLQFEEETTESIYRVWNIQYLYLLNKYIKWKVRG